MKMWMINPKLMCDKHLLGEHGEIHKHKHNFEKKHKMDGRLAPIIQIEPMSMQIRHDYLVEEIIERGMNHKSPFVQPDVSYLGENANAKVDIVKSVIDLRYRCKECRKRINEQLY